MHRVRRERTAAALAFSALYELVEWRTALAFYPEQGPEWLGMLGVPWDARQDVAMGLTGGGSGDDGRRRPGPERVDPTSREKLDGGVTA